MRVVEADSGRLLYAHDQTRLLTPASNTKIVTSATALARWGADYRFRTELYVPPDPPDTGGVLRGNVYIKGYGDPTFSTRAYARNVLRRPAASIDDFVPALQAMGVTRIVGHVVGDESYFDSRRTVSSWSSRRLGLLRSALGAVAQPRRRRRAPRRQPAARRGDQAHAAARGGRHRGDRRPR